MPAEPAAPPAHEHSRAVVAGGLAAAVLAGAFLLAPPLGTDLSAQVARADFFREYGLTTVDLRWYGGTVQYGYSMLSPALMAALGGGVGGGVGGGALLGGGAFGARLAGALALVAATLGLAVLLVRSGVRRPMLGTLLGAGCFAGNLVSGRITFALGVACGVWALAALTSNRVWLRYGGAAAGGLLAAAMSPVAGLFVGLAGVALLLSQIPARTDRSFAVGAMVLTVSAGVPLAVSGLLFADSGRMNITVADAVHASVTGLVVAVLVPARSIRIGALLSSLGVIAAFAFDTPVGLNATRLAIMFALPVVAACAPWRRWWILVPALAVLAAWQPPVLVDDLRDSGNPTASRGYFAPLLQELGQRGPIGRIEVPPTRNSWEAAYVADAVPLARGWLRQADIARNPLFFDGHLDAGTYESWLRDNGVSYVALPDARLSWVAQPEANLIATGLPYLTPVWRSAHWTLYEVAGRPSIVDGADLVSSTGAGVTFDATAAGDVLVRVAQSRWLRTTGPPDASISSRGRWTAVRVPRPGRYTLTSG